MMDREKDIFYVLTFILRITPCRNGLGIVMDENGADIANCWCARGADVQIVAGAGLKSYTIEGKITIVYHELL